MGKGTRDFATMARLLLDRADLIDAGLDSRNLTVHDRQVVSLDEVWSPSKAGEDAVQFVR